VRYLLATDTCLAAINRVEPVLSRVYGRPSYELAVASMTEAELRFDALVSEEPDRELRRTDAFLATFRTPVAFDSSSARAYAYLRRSTGAERAGEAELIMASVAVANGLVLVSGRARELAWMPGVAMENWAAPYPGG
jgi:tRNA(fMet)-specific endonuclease VapC